MSKTVFVIGAGASKEVDLPTGNELKSKIANKLNFKVENRQLKGGDQAINNLLLSHEIRGFINGYDVNTVLAHCNSISSSMPLAISIDNFIDSHKGVKEIELCSKLAVARTILNEEKKCKLTLNGSKNFDFKRIEETWFTRFFQLININTGIQELKHKLSKICLIIFNYDRCVEHFLFNAIKTYYGINEENVKDILSELEVYHPYGCIGSLPWQEKESFVDFGEDVHGMKLLNITKKIKTFTEGMSDIKQLKVMRRRLRNAKSIIFIGFAFHKINMDLLYSKLLSGNEGSKIYATAYLESDSFCEDVKLTLQKQTDIEPANIQIRNDLNCYKLFLEYQRTLAI